MRVARIIVLLIVLGYAALLAGHLLNLPGYPIWGWFTASRYEKEAIFEISGEAFNSAAWVSRLGKNRPKSDRPHEICSELEITVRHETRSGLVRISVVGDSEEEVDSFIHTLKTDFARSYTKPDPEHGFPISTGHFHSTSDALTNTIYWRQRYLGLLSVNIVLLTGAWFLMGRRTTKRAEQDGAGQPATRSESK